MKNLFGFDWKKSNAHLELLSKFNNFNSPDNIYKNENWCVIWKEVLGEHPQKVIKRFIDEKVLVSANLQELLDYKFKVNELKSLCKEKGLPVSGKKTDLISRLIQADEKRMFSLVKGSNLYTCSEGSKIIVNQYLENKRVEKANAENLSFEYLKKKQFGKATKVMVEYEAKQVFQRGIGIDWNSMKPESYVKSLSEIFTCKPLILNDIPDEKMEPIRIMAAFDHLWGRSVSGLFKDMENVHSRLDNEVAARMILFYVTSKTNIAQYRESKGVFKYVKVLVADDSCEYCKKQSNKKYKISGDIPELPDHKCTHEMGCRCNYIVVFDED